MSTFYGPVQRPVAREYLLYQLFQDGNELAAFFLGQAAVDGGIGLQKGVYTGFIEAFAVDSSANDAGCLKIEIFPTAGADQPRLYYFCLGE